MGNITVSSIPIFNIVVFFALYIAIHLAIGMQEKKYRNLLGLPEKQKEAKTLIKNLGEESFHKENFDRYKIFSFLMTWFPAFYIIVILVILYGF